MPGPMTDQELADLDMTRDEYDLAQQKAAGTAPPLQLGDAGTADEDEAARLAAEAAKATKDAADAASAAAAATAAEEAAAAAAAAAADTGTEGAKADDQLAAPAPAVQQYDAGDPTKFDERAAAIAAKKADGLKQMMDGDIDAEAYAKIDAEATKELVKLTTDQTLHTSNVQRETQAQQQALNAIASAAKKAGTIDYAVDAKAQQQFDMALEIEGADPANANVPFDQLLAKAHDAVLGMRGLRPTAAAPAVPAAAAAPAAPGKPKPVIPQTLGHLPAAGAPPVGDDLMSQFTNLGDPDEAEEMLARMPPTQRSNLLRSTIKH